MSRRLDDELSSAVIMVKLCQYCMVALYWQESNVLQII